MRLKMKYNIKDSLISDVTQSDRLRICVVQIQWASKIVLSVGLNAE